MVKYCMPVIPSADLEKSLPFWTEGLGLEATRHMYQNDKLVGCMVHRESLFFWLNRRDGGALPDGYEGIRLYWTPEDITALHQQLTALGYTPSAIVLRDYGQTEFFVTDVDGHVHCLGVETLNG